MHCTSVPEAVACQAAGAALTLVDHCVEAAAKGRVQGGSAKDVPAGFGICRPPGHHAVRQSCMGFCLFSTVAIAARYAQQQHGLQRVRCKVSGDCRLLYVHAQLVGKQCLKVDALVAMYMYVL